MASNLNSNPNSNVVKDLKKIIVDMTRDLLNTFPELNDNLNSSLRAIIDDNDDENIEITKLHEHCRNVFPERFFDILYQNEQMFNDETENNEESKNVNVELKVLERVREKSIKNGIKNPDVIVNFFKNIIIPMTIQVELDYIFSKSILSKKS